MGENNLCPKFERLNREASSLWENKNVHFLAFIITKYNYPGSSAFHNILFFKKSKFLMFLNSTTKLLDAVMQNFTLKRAYVLI